jgi:hypothetical protein
LTYFDVCIGLFGLGLAVALSRSHAVDPFFLVMFSLLGFIVGGVVGVVIGVQYVDHRPDPSGFGGFAAYPIAIAGAALGAGGGLFLAAFAGPRRNHDTGED